MPVKKKVAVLFGGRAPEHDVSILTGLQTLAALDPDLYDAFPVYLTITGEWLMGPALLDRASYIPAPPYKGFEKVSLRMTVKGQGAAFVGEPCGLFGRRKCYDVDFIIPAFHGVLGEDGAVQGLFEVAGVPYAGMRAMASAVFMDKIATKHMLAGTGIPLLPYHVIHRPAQGRLILAADLAKMYPDATFPACIKPANLGSSIGVAKVHNWDELSATLPQIFLLDHAAILEPFVPNLVEYNVAVCALDGRLRTSAIERPKHASELLDFKAKYLSSGGTKGGSKSGGTKTGSKTAQQSSQGMLSLTRELCPEIPAEMEANIRDWAERAFSCVGGTGAPRIDFLCDKETGRVWLNEVNACPGSFGYFLWEAASEPMPFAILLDKMIAEGEACAARARIPEDPTPEAARLFERKKG